MKQTRKFWRASLFILLLAALCGSFAFPVMYIPQVNAAPQIQAAIDVVISEFRVRGSGGAGDEFIEIFNPTATQINLNGWSINRSNDTGSVNPHYSFTTDIFLQPGQHYLIANTAYNDSVTADAFYGTGISDGGGIALFRPDSSIADQVGLGNGSAYVENSALSSLGTNNIDRSYDRKSDGTGLCIDSNNNVSDFFLRNPSDPQNSASPLTICGNPTNTPAPTETPTSTSTVIPPSSVLINEIAWSGTVAANTDEWFELRNTTGNNIDLNGWELVSDDGNPSITLSGTILAGDYFVVARSNLVFNDLIPDLTYSGTFENNPDAEILYLLDSNGNQIDTANVDGGAWNAGLGSPTFATMERLGTTPDGPLAWNTYGGTVAVAHDRNNNDIKGTPGQANWILTVTATPTATTTGTPTLTPTRTLSPTPLGLRSVLINEVAWAGTGASTSDEWIELYNPGTVDINLTGWRLRAPDGTPSIALTGIIRSRGFYLLERTDDTTVLDVPANQIYTGEIENSFESLQLFDSSNRLIDTANANGGDWPAGLAGRPYNTMERRGNIVDSDTAWITNSRPSTWFAHDARGVNSSDYLIRGTPGRANWAYRVTATPSPKPTLTRTRTPTRVPTRPPAFLVAINEFVPRPGHDWNNDGEVNVQDEYIEILNHGTIDVPLGGYTLDDEANEGSEPFRLPSVTLSPGERIVFYGSETGLHLSDGGDGVRLLRPNGQLIDAFNYTIARFADQSFCRLPDNGGLDDWSDNCFPTPGLQNSLSGDFVEPIAGGETEQLCPIADTLPDEFVFAECPGFGNNIWRRTFWDEEGWYGEKVIPGLDRRWDVYAD